MSEDFGAYADGLMLEALSDTAQTFFGARTGLEREMELFGAKARELAGYERRVRRRAGSLHWLLMEGERAGEFYRAIEVDPGHLADGVDPGYRAVRFVRPFALTARGRYVKCVLYAYDTLQEAMDIYLHGRHYPDPDGSGRKLETANYKTMQGWCARINQRIFNLNHTMSPSGTMCFFRSLDPLNLARERTTGATVDGMMCDLDSKLAFRPLPCLDLDNPVFHELPPLAAVRSRAATVARKVYALDPVRAGRLLAEVVQEED